MRSLRFCILLLVLFAAAACEKAADLENPNDFAGHGIEFSYPGNWKVTEDYEEDGIGYVTIESPGEAIAVITVFQPDLDVVLAEYAGLYVDATVEGVPVGQVYASEPVEISSPNARYEPEGIEQKLTMSLLGGEVPHTLRFFQARGVSGTVVLCLSVADEDAGMVTGGFELILKTLLVV